MRASESFQYFESQVSKSQKRQFRRGRPDCIKGSSFGGGQGLDGTDAGAPLLPALTTLQPLFQSPSSEPSQSSAASETNTILFLKLNFLLSKTQIHQNYSTQVTYRSHCICRPQTPTSPGILFLHEGVALRSMDHFWELTEKKHTVS